MCDAPKIAGYCHLKLQRWYYNKTTQMCHQFTYTGCDVNSNNFESEHDCRSMCNAKETSNNYFIFYIHILIRILTKYLFSYKIHAFYLLIMAHVITIKYSGISIKWTENVSDSIMEVKSCLFFRLKCDQDII
jgi:hypothetical protein